MSTVVRPNGLLRAAKRILPVLSDHGLFLPFRRCCSCVCETLLENTQKHVWFRKSITVMRRVSQNRIFSRRFRVAGKTGDHYLEAEDLAASTQYSQENNFGIHVSAKDNAERAPPVDHGSKQGHMLRFVTQSLAWIAGQTRSDQSCRISRMRSTFENAFCSRFAENVTTTWNTCCQLQVVASTSLLRVPSTVQFSSRLAMRVLQFSPRKLLRNMSSLSKHASFHWRKVMH